MLIEFSVTNFRLIKDEQCLSMETDLDTTHLDNTFQANEELRLLKTTVIYGANASGKTNLIAAALAFCRFIVNSTDLKKDDPIECYKPFKLDKSFRTQPSSFKIAFLGNDNIKYQYEISLNKKKVLSEELTYYPNGIEVKVFTRKPPVIELGEGFLDKNVTKKVLENRLFLSEAANNLGDEQMGTLYSYFKKIEFWNVIDNISLLSRKVSEIYANDSRLAQKLSQLIKVCDTKIEMTLIRERDESEFQLPDDLSADIKQNIITQNKYGIKTFHQVYEQGIAVDTQPFELTEESEGTQILYALGGLILKQFETGGVIFFDEFNNSLHPKLCRFLIRLFHNPKSNPKNTQLIFATHETSLLDNSLFRKDQIWFTEKNKFGETELFSASDFEGVQNNAPFQNWYMAGKFDAQPHIKEIEFIYGT
jgi:AAA15 family ATPase/GTPase